MSQSSWNSSLCFAWNCSWGGGQAACDSIVIRCLGCNDTIPPTLPDTHTHTCWHTLRFGITNCSIDLTTMTTSNIVCRQNRYKGVSRKLGMMLLLEIWTPLHSARKHLCLVLLAATKSRDLKPTYMCTVHLAGVCKPTDGAKVLEHSYCILYRCVRSACEMPDKERLFG